MLHNPARHEPLRPLRWDPGRVQQAIEHIVRATEQACPEDSWWPLHPHDRVPHEDPTQPATPMYHGAAGTVWALDHLHRVGAVEQRRRFDARLDELRQRNAAWLATTGHGTPAAWLMGDTPLLMLQQGWQPTAERADALAALIAGNTEHPACELMWGGPGTMLAAWLLHRRFGDARWAELFRRSAARLWQQLEWHEAEGCHAWWQLLSGRRYSFLDGVHGFVATAGVLLRGSALLAAADWDAWREVIVGSVTRTATRADGQANWRVQLIQQNRASDDWLMQFCHGAPGFVIALAAWPDDRLDELLLEAGNAIWQAGPLRKGANLCHGTGGNGYALLALWQRSGDERWLQRARAFAMHAITQTEADESLHGGLRPSLWTGDPGLAIYLWDCLRAKAAFPTLDRFYADDKGSI